MIETLVVEQVYSYEGAHELAVAGRVRLSRLMYFPPSFSPAVRKGRKII